jgi:hypothetical protein
MASLFDDRAAAERDGRAVHELVAAGRALDDVGHERL